MSFFCRGLRVTHGYQQSDALGIWVAELTMGQWVMGQMSQQICMGYVGHR